MYCNRNRLEFLKYCSLVKAMISLDNGLKDTQNLFEDFNYKNHSVKELHKNRFETFCKVNLSLIERLDLSDKRFIEKGKNDFIGFMVECSNDKTNISLKKTVFIKTIHHFIKRNNIDNKHMIFQKLNHNSSTLDFIKNFSSYINTISNDKQENVIAEKFFKRINNYSL